jgi:gamma-D-glutamyl-L-lysine dipeptidyl-peptidase
MRPALAPALALAVLAGAGLCALAGPASAAGAEAHPPARWVRVSVATLWVRPDEARSVDAPACAFPARPRAWVAALSVAQKRWLVGRLETQALYGAKVYVLGTSGAWSHVMVAGQPTHRRVLGYPGWLPTRQLTSTEPRVTRQIAVVRRPTAWLFRTAALDGHVLELSYGTRLPVLSSTSEAVEVARPEGGSAYLRRTSVALHAPGTAWPALSGARLVTEARRFLGLQYLWAGTSGFGLDCSGFTYLVYRALGVTIPRDADDQATVGTKVDTRGALRAGDLVFFRNESGIHHVGLFVGDDKMIHAPGTGHAVTIVSLDTEPYGSEFAGGRRLTP